MIMPHLFNDFSFNENEQKNLRLNEKELSIMENFDDLSSEERDNLKELIFNLSMAIYKSFKHEPA
jgi:hypothetical protein